jgi:hypothetical protein
LARELENCSILFLDTTLSLKLPQGSIASAGKITALALTLPFLHSVSSTFSQMSFVIIIHNFVGDEQFCSDSAHHTLLPHDLCSMLSPLSASTLGFVRITCFSATFDQDAALAYTNDTNHIPIV